MKCLQHFGGNVGIYSRKISNEHFFLEFLFSRDNRYLVSGQICQFLQGLRFGVTTPYQVFLDCRAVGTDETIPSTPRFWQIRYPYFNRMRRRGGRLCPPYYYSLPLPLPILRPSDGPGFVSIFANSRRTPTKFNEAYNIQTSLDTTKLNIIHDGMVGTVHCFQGRWKV